MDFRNYDNMSQEQLRLSKKSLLSNTLNIFVAEHAGGSAKRS